MAAASFKRFKTAGIAGFLATLSCCPLPGTAQSPPQTGPQTENRFPPLSLREGFRATLFACDPLVEYPSVIALGPRPGTLFVAYDYMTGLGKEIVKRDEIRIVEDTDDDGYADTSSLYAGGFNSIQGLAFYRGTVYAMHAPFLTALRDTDGDGAADERRDLASGLGLPPEENDVRLHCANGVTAGHDGWLYLALGDHGCDVPRPGGGRVVLEGGGILRCRFDGSDLHIFATGTRNIYDIALDEELNVFLRDNENDGGAYKNRVYHSFHGADHGYPYHYYERPDEAMAPLADVGLGSSAGGVCYLETGFPPPYRGNLFFCEWGRSLVRYERRRDGSHFAPMEEFEFAAGAESDRYPFKPTDVIVDRDGSLLVADWADGQRPMRGRARIYRIRHGQEEEPAAPFTETKDRTLDGWITALNSKSYYARGEAQAALEALGPRGLEALDSAIKAGNLDVMGRLHAVWIVALTAGPDGLPRLLDFAENDAEPRVRAQAIRAIADVAAFSSSEIHLRLAESLAALARPGQDPRVVLEIVIALGRLQWPGLPGWMAENLERYASDQAIRHAAMQSLRRSGNRPAVLELLDRPGADPVRAVTLRAMAGQAENILAEGLIARLQTESSPVRRREYADALARIHRKPGPWVYWTYRPPPRPANTVSWESTASIARALEDALADSDLETRAFILEQMQRERISLPVDRLARWLEEDRDENRVRLILGSLREKPANEVRSVLERIVLDQKRAMPNRLEAFEIFAENLDSVDSLDLRKFAGALEDGPVLARVIREWGEAPELDDPSIFFEKLKSPSTEVRASAIAVLGKHRVRGAEESVRRLLDDPDPALRLAAATAAGRLPAPSAAGRLLDLAENDPDPALRCEILEALRVLGDSRAVPLALRSLEHRDTQLAAVNFLAAMDAGKYAARISDAASRNPSTSVLDAAARALARWERSGDAPELRREIARFQGLSGHLARWKVSPPLDAAAARAAVAEITGADAADVDAPLPPWRDILATGADSAAKTPRPKESLAGAIWLCVTDIAMEKETPVQFLASANGPLRVWINGEIVRQSQSRDGYQPNAERFSATLARGTNRVLLEIESEQELRFQARFRRRSTTAAQEQLMQAALTGRGNAARGHQLFFDPAKSQCILCHRLGEEGGRIGPDLSGVGGRFSRIYIIESILTPSSNITPGFQTVSMTLRDGLTAFGVKVDETDTTVTIGDVRGMNELIGKKDIIDIIEPPVSLMPPGLENLLTQQEFVDLVAFLISQK